MNHIPLSSLNSLRFLFVLMIFMSHFAYRSIAAFPAGGDCGVAFFFILSGFVLTHRYETEIKAGTFRYLPYLRRRLIKIWPLHLLCLVLWIVVTHAPIDHRTAINALLLQSWIPDATYYFSYNSVSWFLSTILFSYLVFPIACRHASWALLTLILSIYLIAYLLVPRELTCALLYVQPVARFVDFFLGIMLHTTATNNGLHPTAPTRPPRGEENGGELCGSKFFIFHFSFFFFLLALLIASLIAYPYLDVKWRNAPLFWIVLLPLILYFAKLSTLSSPRGKATGRRAPLGNGWEGLPLSSLLSPLSSLSSLVLPFFMLHPLIINILKHRLDFLPAGAMLVVCLVVTLTVSWVVDKYLLSRIK